MVIFEKSPADIQDYDIKFNRWLDSLSDTIASVTVVPQPGFTLVSWTNVGGVIKVWTAGGSDGGLYTVTIYVTTTGGRVKQHAFQIQVKDKR